MNREKQAAALARQRLEVANRSAMQNDHYLSGDESNEESSESH